MTQVRAFLKDTSGTTAIEYAIVAGCISVLIVAGASSIGSKLTNLYFNKVAGNLT